MSTVHETQHNLVDQLNVILTFNNTAGWMGAIVASVN